MLRLEGLYGAQQGNPQQANSRGGTSWQQQYAGRMRTAPGGPTNSSMASQARLGGANAGMMQRQPGAGVNPNQRQMSPQAQAMFEQWRQRAAMPPAQGMAQDRGVFSGGQQAAQMPGLPNGGRLAALYG